MVWPKLLLPISVAIACGCTTQEPGRAVVRPPGASPAVGFKAGDTEMEAAEAKAKSTLNQFIARMKATKGDEYFTVKAGLETTDGGPEYFWLDDTTFANGRFSGTLADEPFNVPGFKKGSKVTVAVDKIADWIISKNGKFEGGFTYDIVAKEAGEPLLPR